MAVYTALDRKALQGFVDTFGLGKLSRASGVPAGSVNTHYLLESQKGRFFLKIDEVKSEEEAQHELNLLLFLRQHGFACPKPLADRHGRYLSDYGNKAVSVYPYLSGKALLEAELTSCHLEKVGKTMASLHLLGQGYKKMIENRFSFEHVRDWYHAMRERVASYFKYVTHTLDDEIEHQEQYREEKLPKGIIHGDLFPDNLLFRGGKIVGVLDFEAACHGKFIYDLATAVNALCYLDGQYQLERFNALIDGYQRARTLSLTEWDAFPNEMRFSALRFTVTRLKDFFFRPTDGSSRIDKDFRDFFERLQVLRRERAGGMDHLLLAMATGYDYRKYQRPPMQEKPTGKKLPAKKRGNGKASREVECLKKS